MTVLWLLLWSVGETAGGDLDEDNVLWCGSTVVVNVEIFEIAGLFNTTLGEFEPFLPTPSPTLPLPPGSP